MAGGSKKAVYAAIGANTAVAIAKLVGWGFTGSGAMLSEGIHSLADVGNQSLLAIGIKHSEKEPDADHPYGYGRAQFSWALISACGIFFLGAGVTIMHGIHSLQHPEPPEDLTVAFVILAVSFLIEGWTYWVAFKSVREQAKAAKMSLFDYIKDGPDPMGVAVLIEDSAACLGIVIAALCLWMADMTQNGMWDGIGSILVGVLLGLLAIFLIRKNKAYLLGRSMDATKRDTLVKVIADHEAVEEIHDVKATVLGASSARFKAEVNFDGKVVAEHALRDMDVTAIWESVNSEVEMKAFLIEFGEKVLDQLDVEEEEIEQQMKDVAPELKHIDLEADE
ncbi:MAG: cation diffusion facilitator family transporter [Proteobacteria bacterium]|nr:cation diffusion facilitator family transporter [Pseudomonadota bacterium]MCP4918028.1 cation diffusion facilitator family transporter [Pseudomonadota bacterium]